MAINGGYLKGNTLQDKKKKLNDESWDLMRKGKDDKTTESNTKK